MLVEMRHVTLCTRFALLHTHCAPLGTPLFELMHLSLHVAKIWYRYCHGNLTQSQPVETQEHVDKQSSVETLSRSAIAMALLARRVASLIQVLCECVCVCMCVCERVCVCV